MTENKMSEVAKLLGLELDEEFIRYGLPNKYKLSENGLMYWSDIHQSWLFSSDIGELLTGKHEIVKISKPLLTKDERDYLSTVIKPFRNSVDTIKKSSYSNGDEFLRIKLSQPNRYEYMNMPYFKEGTRYKGMKLDTEYTINELVL